MTSPKTCQHHGSDTADRILDTAEALFATQGIGATSLRALTRAAGVNLAAVHYHFGSKEALLDAVVERRARVVNRERIDALERVCKGAGPGDQVERIVAAFVDPGRKHGAALGERQQVLARLLARIHAQDPVLVERLTGKHFGDVMRRFVEALQRALPEVPPTTVAHRFRFALGTLLYVFSANFALDSIPGHPVEVDDDALFDELVSYLTAGFRADAAQAPSLKAVSR